MRLGTATQKLSDATDVPTAPVNLITALASVVTLPATQATGSGIVATYSPVTATFDATVSTESPVTAQFQALFRTEPAVTALFRSGISLVTPVTASITVGILTAVTQFIPTTAGSLTSATFSFIPTATFSAAIDRSPNIFNYLAGDSENLVYPRSLLPLYLTAQMNSPQAAVVCCGFSGGSVSTISIIARGQGYPSGNYGLVFSGGGATAGTVTATAQVAITNGRVGSITLSSGGSGYASAPIATLFTPDKSLLSILPTNALGEVNGKRQFSWVLGRTPGDSAPIRFTQPDTTSVVTFNTTPSASLVFVQGNTWEINIENSGYGYVATPTVTHDAAPASTAKITFSRTVCGGFLQTISTAGLLFIRNGGIPLLPEFFSSTSRAENILDMSVPFPFGAGPRLGTTTTLSLLRIDTGNQQLDSVKRLLSELEQSSFAGREFFATITAGSTNIGALVRASVPQINLDYEVEVDAVYSIGGSKTGQRDYAFKRVDGGGIWETSFEIVDYGDSYANNFPRSNLVGLLPLKTGSTILQSPIEQVVTIPLQASNGYANTIISQSPTIATRPGRTSTETFISSGGLGFVDRGTSREPVAQAFSGFSATVTSQTVTAGGLIISTTPGIVTTARIIAFPKAYTPGTYDCEVASPATGTRAQIQLIVTSTTASVVILDGGSGYTTAPVITAPAPNGRNGFVNLLVATNAFSGYTAGVINPLEFAPSVATGGTAEGEFEVGESKVTFASRVGIVGSQQALIFNGVSTDPFGQLGVRRKEEPPIPAGSILLGASNKTVVAESDDGLQEIQQFIQKFAFIRLTNQGFGYTTPPTVLAPAPSRAVGGTIVDIRLTNIPKGYKENQTYALQVTTAPDPLGSSEASFQIFKVERLVTLKNFKETANLQSPRPDELRTSFRNFIAFDSNSRYSSPTLLISDDFYLGLNFTNGFSYTTAPTITAPSPDNDLLGNIIGLLPTNNPVGYRPDTTYPLVIGSSPRLDGGAAGEFTVSSLGVISTRITDGGFGYTTKPSVVAPAPDLVQGTISGVSVSTLGRGFAPGAYPCNITEAPLGGETASVLFNVDSLGVGQFQVISKGGGYVTRPIVSVPTQSGNIVSGITITCGGSFYEQSTAKFQVLDPSGLGASFGEPIILSGKINQVPIVVGGYGFSANPIIQFSAPTQPAISPLEASAVEGEFNITTASANAILLTATQRDILLEVYETDGTNEQVVAQATVSLAKRVLE